ncbi:MAG: hypothetical protein Kow0092_15860 [Deferrisomatales bacterium]
MARIPIVRALVIAASLVAGATASQAQIQEICRGCHGQSVANRHHLLVQTEGKLCLDCHKADWDPDTQSFDFAEFRDCTVCHGADVASAHPECLTCHDAAIGARRAVGAEFAMSSHHIQPLSSGEAQKGDCQECHDLSEHMGGVVLLRNADGGAPVAYDGPASATPFCLGCHDEDSKGDRPFSDGRTPVSSARNWDGKSIDLKYSADQVVDSNKYLPTEPAPNMGGWTYNTVPNERKALSAHGNPAANQPNGSQLDRAVPCLGCHNAHGSGMGPLLFSNAQYSPESVEDYCWDCHLNDENSPMQAASYLAGDWVRDYYGDFRWGLNDGSGFQLDHMSTFAYKDGRFLSSHFYPSKRMISETNWVRSPITCTDCHDPHGVDPTLPDSDYMVPLLKGTWLISPYKEDRTPQANFVSQMLDPGYSGGKERLPDHVPPQGAKRPRPNPELPFNNPPDPGQGYPNDTGGTGHEGYFIDGNTFGVYNPRTGRPGAIRDWKDYKDGSGGLQANYIREDISQFGGLCMNCHDRQTLESVWTGHGTVKGWSGAQRDLFPSYLAEGKEKAKDSRGVHNMGKYDDDQGNYSRGYRWDVNPRLQRSSGYIQRTYHQFPCSKCHTPHASGLPRLMATNCLDVAGNHTSFGYSKNPQATNCHSTERGLDWNRLTPWTQGGTSRPPGPGDGAGTLRMAEFVPAEISVEPDRSAPAQLRVTNDSGRKVKSYDAEFDVTGGLTVSGLSATPRADRAEFRDQRLHLRWQDVPAGTDMVASFSVQARRTGVYEIRKRTIQYELDNGERSSGTSNNLRVVVERAAASGDGEPPSRPEITSASGVTEHQIRLLWTVSVDNVGVAGYRVYRDDRPVASTADTQYLDSGLDKDRRYTYRVSAYDAAGNESEWSGAREARTKD